MSFNGMAIFDKLAEKEKVRNRKFLSRKEQMYYHLNRYNNGETPVLSYIVEYIEDGVIDEFFIKKNDTTNERSLKINVILELLFNDEVTWEYDYYKNMFKITFSNNEQLILDEEEWKTLISTFEIKYNLLTKEISGSIDILDNFFGWLDNKDIKFVIS